MTLRVYVLENLFIRSGLIGILIPLAFTAQLSAADKSQSSLPNILLIMADDVGYTDISNLLIANGELRPAPAGSTTISGPFTPLATMS